MFVSSITAILLTSPLPKIQTLTQAHWMSCESMRACTKRTLNPDASPYYLTTPENKWLKRPGVKHNAPINIWYTDTETKVCVPMCWIAACAKYLSHSPNYQEWVALLVQLQLSFPVGKIWFDAFILDAVFPECTLPIWFNSTGAVSSLPSLGNRN